MNTNISNVYFIPLNEKNEAKTVGAAAKKLLEYAVKQESFQLEKQIPLKVHFGEKGNYTYLKPENYLGIIEYLQSQNIDCFYTETSVLYGGERFKKSKHLKLAQSHGFTQIPVVIADGENGEAANDVKVDLKHFKSCSVAKVLAESPQVLVLSHFKGHALAGFGGAVKQLSMGFAAKGGKMAMHLGVKPQIRNWRCKHCKLCMSRCNAGAITIGEKSFIDHEKCIGCGACFSICPHHAVSILSFSGLWNALFKGKIFREKLVEYAYAASHGKKHIYMNFAVNVTGGCDCEPRPMLRCTPDIGIFLSCDPVAVDAACYDAVSAHGKKFRGHEQLDYAEKIKLGNIGYNLITVV